MNFLNGIFFVIVFSGVSVGFTSEDLLANPERKLEQRTGLFSSIEGYAISLVYKALQVFDAFACVSACVKEPSCQSVNFDTSGHPMHHCELSQQAFDCSRLTKVPRPGFTHYFPVRLQHGFVVPEEPCRNITCKNGATCEPSCNEQGYLCKCGPFNQGQYCQLWTVEVSSCKDIFSKTSYRTDMAYTYMIDNKQTDVYCHLSSNLCGSRGWTLAMKIDGSKDTFAYASPLWSNKNAYDLSAGQTGFDHHETKMPSYWAMPLQSLCVGMKVGNNLNWVPIPYTASSLYDVIVYGRYFPFTIGRNKWMSLIGGSSSLQQNCNAEGFNFKNLVRIGIMANEQNDCASPDSGIGFGLALRALSCGNHCVVSCSNGHKEIVAFGYILIT